jgi:ATP-dependent Clp protease ATP-binding subunit ClpC
MDPKTIKEQFIVCPVCSGSGKTKLGFACGNCNGMGIGIFSFGRFFFWGPRLGLAMIELKHLRDKAQTLINLLAFAASLAGLLSLGFWVYETSRLSHELGAFAFWQYQNVYILVFWVSLLFDMFIFYRMSEQERKKHRIQSVNYDSKKKRYNTPSDWEGLQRFRGKIKIDVAEGFDVKAEKIVEQAYLLASKMNHEKMLPIHLFFASLNDKEVAAILSRLNISPNKFISNLKKHLGQCATSKGWTEISAETKEVLVNSYLDAMKFGQKKVDAKNFIIPIIKKDKFISELLYELEIDQDKIFNVLLWFIVNDKQVESYRMYQHMARFKPGNNMDRAYTAVATQTLNHFAYDLTAAAKWGRLEYCVAREKDLENIFQSFESGASGVLLSGPVGVGKNTVIDGVAQLMVKEDVPKIFKDKRLVELDASRLISGVNPAQAEGRMLEVIDEIVRAGNIILYIANIEKIIGITSGTEESLDLSEILASALGRRNLFCLASATDENYIKYIEGRSLGNVFSRVKIEEPQGNQAIQIVESKVGALEGKYNVFFSYNAIEESIKLTQKYIHDKYLPDKAIKVLELSALKMLKPKGEQCIISREDVASIISKQTGIPAAKLSQSESDKLLNLEEKMHERMIGQEEAVNMIAASLRRARVELREGKRPIANFLFLGPTGVGKTELAKTVAEFYFGREDYMLRIDMSEYQHPDSISKMIGDNQGARGYLTEAVRKTPYCLVLLDELEKAHPDILNLFLQVMDDGRLTDGQGRTIDFTNCIIIATSNAGALFIQQEVLKGTDIRTLKDTLINEHLTKVMRPEFINRFDGVIVFEPLSLENVVEIARLMLGKTKKMLKAKGIEFKFEEGGLRTLSSQGFDPKFGARPLRRLLQDKVDDRIASLILSGKLKRRDTVCIDEKADVLVEKANEL